MYRYQQDLHCSEVCYRLETAAAFSPTSIHGASRGGQRLGIAPGHGSDLLVGCCCRTVHGNEIINSRNMLSTCVTARVEERT